jgi:hypothetical protein
MMRLVYHQAVVGFSADLTKADEKSIPVAALLVGKLDDGAPVAALMMVFEQFDDLDPMTRRILEKAPEMLRQHVDDAFSGDVHEPLDKIIVRLHHSLRNSLHVMNIDAPAEKELADVRMGLIEIVVKRLGVARTEVGASALNFPERPPANQKRRRSGLPRRPPVAQAIESWTPTVQHA